MRVTLVIAGLGGGGAERVCINLANAWAAQGKHATILTISQNRRAPAYTIDARVELRDIGWPRAARSNELNHIAIAPVLRLLHSARCPQLIHDITMLAMLRHAILATKPDVAVAFIDRTNVRVIAAMPETGVPVVACEQTDTRRVSLRLLQGAREELYRRAAAVVAPDPVIAQWLAGKGARARAIANPLTPPSKPKRRSKDKTKACRHVVTFIIRKAAGVSCAIVCEYRARLSGMGPGDLRRWSTTKHARTSDRETCAEPDSPARFLERPVRRTGERRSFRLSIAD